MRRLLDGHDQAVLLLSKPFHPLDLLFKLWGKSLLRFRLLCNYLNPAWLKYQTVKLVLYTGKFTHLCVLSWLDCFQALEVRFQGVLCLLEPQHYQPSVLLCLPLQLLHLSVCYEQILVHLPGVLSHVGQGLVVAVQDLTLFICYSNEFCNLSVILLLHLTELTLACDQKAFRHCLRFLVHIHQSSLNLAEDWGMGLNLAAVFLLNGDQLKNTLVMSWNLRDCVTSETWHVLFICRHHIVQMFDPCHDISVDLFVDDIFIFCEIVSQVFNSLPKVNWVTSQGSCLLIDVFLKFSESEF